MRQAAKSGAAGTGREGSTDSEAVKMMFGNASNCRLSVQDESILKSSSGGRQSVSAAGMIGDLADPPLERRGS